MKRKSFSKKIGNLSKLEKIFAGIIILVGIFFVINNFPKQLLSKEAHLEKRYLEFVDLMGKNDYAGAYGYFSASVRNKGSYEDFKESTANEKGKTQAVEIVEITIRGIVGYIDRYNTVCDGGNDCLTVRGYKRWVYENGDWYESLSDPVCIREEKHYMAPEFERALSLYYQRIGKLHVKNGYKNFDDSMKNCLEIKYGDVNDAEGVFTFDSEKTSLEKYTIMVDRSYKANDDILTAFLLAHEIIHAINHQDRIAYNSEISCIEDEVEAFRNQLAFSASLNTQEWNSISKRIDAGYTNPNSSLQLIKDLHKIENAVMAYCGYNNQNCYEDKLVKDLENWVRSNPYYQKQCGL